MQARAIIKKYFKFLDVYLSVQNERKSEKYVPSAKSGISRRACGNLKGMNLQIFDVSYYSWQPLVWRI